MTLTVDALLGEVAPACRRPRGAPAAPARPAPAGSTTTGRRRRRTVAGRRGPAAAPAARSAPIRSASARSGLSVGQQHVRRAEHPVAGARRSWRRSTCAPRRTATVAVTVQPGDRAALARSRRGSRWAAGRRRPARRARARRSSSVVAAERAHLGQPHAVLGERAGLVRAHDVDAGQALDRRQLLHQALPLARAGRRRRRTRCWSAAPGPRAPSAPARRPCRAARRRRRCPAVRNWLQMISAAAGTSR